MDTRQLWMYKISKNLAVNPRGLLALSLVNLLKNPLIEKNLLLPKYHKLIEKHQKDMVALDSVESAIVDQLDRTGICVTSLESLQVTQTPQFLQEANCMLEALVEQASLEMNQGKSMLYCTPKQFLKYPEVFRWGLQERMLRIVEGYLRLPIAYNGCALSYSMPDGNELGDSTRLWHVDRHDRRILKVGVYLNDVDETSGPFEYLKQDLSSSLPEMGTGIHKYVRSNQESSNSVVGKAGTVFFADTARLVHRGKPPTHSHRFAIYFAYFSRRPSHPFWCGKPGFSREELNYMTTPFKPQAKAAAEWRENLPPILRLLSYHGAS